MHEWPFCTFLTPEGIVDNQPQQDENFLKWISRANQAFDRHRSEQYFTWSQSRAHFLRQANGRPHAAQTLVGKSPFLTILGMTTVSLSGARRASPGITLAGGAVSPPR